MKTRRAHAETPRHILNPQRLVEVLSHFLNGPDHPMDLPDERGEVPLHPRSGRAVLLRHQGEVSDAVWVHAAHPMEAIKKVAIMTGKPAEECAGLLFEVNKTARAALNRVVT